jgi:hypothetical protein
MIEKISNAIAKILELEKQAQQLLSLKEQLYGTMMTRFQFKLNYVTEPDKDIEVEGKIPLNFNYKSGAFEDYIEAIIAFDGRRVKVYDDEGVLKHDFYLDDVSLNKLILVAEWEEKTKFLTKTIESTKDAIKNYDEKLKNFKEILAAVKLMIK